MDRRKFLKYSLAGSLVAGFFPSQLYSNDTRVQSIHPGDKIKLGSTGIRTSRMAMGTGTNGYGGSSNQTRKLGIKGLPDLMHAAYDEGILFWDSADQYGSHEHVKKALKHVPRDKVTILTKTNSRTREDVEADLERFRKEMGTDYLDIVLLHAVSNSDWPSTHKGGMEALSKAREEGIIRAHGVSCHSLGALRAAAEEPWVMVDLARFNHAGVRMDDDVPTVKKVLQRMKANGKAIVSMKVYGAGDLVDQKDEALRFQANYQKNENLIDAFTMGLESHEQLQDIQKRLPAVSASV
ncbi:MAG: aldo/keto reductase [Bacteroidales bacterium]|nr:aldo/keto reductase [Bacteroidales bacterium]